MLTIYQTAPYLMSVFCSGPFTANKSTASSALANASASSWPVCLSSDQTDHVNADKEIDQVVHHGEAERQQKAGSCAAISSRVADHPLRAAAIGEPPRKTGLELAAWKRESSEMLSSVDNDPHRSASALPGFSPFRCLVSLSRGRAYRRRGADPTNWPGTPHGQFGGG